MKNKILKNKGSSDLGLLLIVILVLFLLWIFTGGPNRPETKQDILQKDPLGTIGNSITP
jgi:hypothetical protein